MAWVVFEAETRRDGALAERAGRLILFLFCVFVCAVVWSVLATRCFKPAGYRRFVFFFSLRLNSLNGICKYILSLVKFGLILS